MRKTLIISALVLLLIFLLLIVTKGLHIGGIDVWGINNISEKNEDIDSKNAKLTSLIDTNYETAMTNLKTSSETLQETKKQYEQKAIVLSENKYYKQTDHYKHEFVLVKVGNYAEENNVDIRMIVTESATSGLYDLNFTITGKYADVASFIYDIENDSSLGFKIENFIEVSATATQTKEDGTTTTINAVKANFYCREVSIDLKWIDENETAIPGIITRGNPFITSTTKLTGKYKNEKLEGKGTTTNSGGNTTGEGNTTGNGTGENTNTGNETANQTAENTNTGNGTLTGETTNTDNGVATGAGETTNTSNGAVTGNGQ